MLFEKLVHKPKNIIIAGCGRFGAGIAGELGEKGFHVMIIDKDEEAFRKLPESFSGFEIVGDATDVELLERTGIKDAYMVIATTNSDNINSLIAQIASRIYGVGRVYARFNETEKELIIDGFNIEVIYPFKLSLNEFERLSNLNERGGNAV